MPNWISESAISFAVLLLYLVIFIPSVRYYEVPPNPPAPGSEGRGLNLTQALIDLQSITTRPHPFNSRANDAVRSYILSRLEHIQDETRSLNIDTDSFSNVTWYAGGMVKYFEGNNIMVKIEGQNPVLEAVLFSAHYDSVSTSYGATDNGMGVATLLQLISYFSINKPTRSVMFNINNGEEDGLHGSHAFLNHPWSKEVGSFLNLEGAGAGGLPIVFRTSSYQVTQALREVSHPHGSVLCADAFALGLIRSSTDYSVYTAAGMSGIDFAFYQRRSYYHTLRDTISNLNGHGSLWAFIDSSLSMGIALTQIDSSNFDQEDKQLPFHFDIFANALVLFTLNQFYTVNLILLGIGVGFYVLRSVYASPPISSMLFAKEALYFPTACIFSVIMLVGLCYTYTFINPYIVHSSNYLVAFSAFILAFVSLHIPLSYLPGRAQNLHGIILYEMNLFWWLILLLNTVLLVRRGIGGLYFITFFYGTSLLALIVESFTFKEAVGSLNSAETDSDDQNENTPLLQRTVEQTQISYTNYRSCWLWTLELLLCVPLPVGIMTQIAVILINALSQTLTDGSSAKFVYAMIALVAFLLVVPMAPFMPMINRNVSFALLLLFVLVSGFNLLSHPFVAEAPLKVFFYQTVNLTGQTNTVYLTGIEGYIQKIVHQVPSALHHPVSCKPIERGLTTCSWSSTATITRDMVSINYEILRSGEATLAFKGEDTRFCRIRFDSPISSLHVHNTTGEIQAGYPLPTGGPGIKELRLWSRQRGKEFTVDVSWSGNETLDGRVSCGWSDSEDWENRNPAFKEILAFLPSWSVVSSLKDELAEASLEFSI